MKAYIKMEKNIEFGDIEIQEQKFYLHNRPISIKNIDIQKVVASNKVSFGKKGFKYSIGYNNAKKIDFCIYFSQKRVLIEETFMKVNICLFW